MVANIPPLPDELIEKIRQLSDTADSFQWQIGDILSDVWDEVGQAYAAILDSERKAHAYIIGQIATRAGIAKSTLRDRESMSRFFPQAVREQLIPLTYHQIRAIKSAGDQWQIYRDWVFDQANQNGYFPSVETIRDQIKADGAECPLWSRRLIKVLPVLEKISLDPDAPQDIRGDIVEFVELVDLRLK